MTFEPNIARSDQPWSFITDFEVDPASLAHPELHSLASVWNEQRHLLASSSGLESFNARLRREWSVETGLLERIYSLDRGVTQILIERGIDAALIPDQGNGQDSNRVAAIIRDHEAAIEGLFSFVKGERALSTSYIKELHALLTRNQPTTTAIDQLGRAVELTLLRGAYKTQPNNPLRPDGGIHEYCPPEHVASEMEQLIALHRGHHEVSPEVEAAWLHHRFTEIHPFQDGNGRVARALATLVLIKAGWFPLVVRDIVDERRRYIKALESADAGNLTDLVTVIAAAQKRAMVQALGVSGQVIKLRKAEHVIAATRELLVDRERARRGEWEKAKRTAAVLQAVATERFGEIARSLQKDTAQHFDHASFFVDKEPHDGDRGHFFRWQIIQTARQVGYFANTTEFRSWARLVLRTDAQAEILISFHATGHEFRGILAASSCFFRRETTEEGEREINDVTPLSSELFQINYVESQANAAARFRDWLEDVLVQGLEHWRTGL